MASVAAGPRRLREDEPLLWVRGVDHSFGTGPTANQVLFNIDLEVLPGELVILAGISGCGKTTLLTLIGGLRALVKPDIGIWNPDRGDYDTLYQMTESELVKLRQRIGFIFQRHNLFDSLTAAQNVRMSQQLQPPDTAEWERLSRAVREADLDPRQRLQPLPAGLNSAKLEAILAQGGRIQPPALVLPAEANATFEELLHTHGWRLDPTHLPLPRPADPIILARFRKRGFGIEPDALRLPEEIHESDWLALRELGLNFGGRRLPLLGDSLEERLAPLLAAGARVDPAQLLLPIPPDEQIDELLARIGLRSTEHSLVLPEGFRAGPALQNLLEQLRLNFHQGTLALPPTTEADLPSLILGLRCEADPWDHPQRLWFTESCSIFAIRLLQSMGVPIERSLESGRPRSCVQLPRNTPVEAVRGLLDLWPRLQAKARDRDMIHASPGRLSGGQRQRVAICRALINRPQLILADEPTAALDPERKLQVIQLLKAYALLDGVTSLIVTHDENIMRQADRIVTMVQGRIASNVVVAEETFVYNALRRSALFAALAPEVQLALTSELLLGVHPTQDVPDRVKERCPWFEVHPPGTTIVRQGDLGGRAYLIRRGEVEVLRQAEERVTLADGTEGLVPTGELIPVRNVEGEPIILGPGDFFGDQAVLSRRRRNATIRAKTTVETYYVTEKRFAVYREESLPLINRILGVYAPPGTPLVDPLEVPEEEGVNAGGN